MNIRWKRLLILCLISLSLAGLLASPASAQTPFVSITGSPLTIQVFQDGGLQVTHAKYQKPQTFGTEGSGFALSFDTNTYGFNDASMEFLDQSPVTGSGSASDPFQVVQRHRITHNDVTLDVTQTVRYVNGSQSFTLDWQVANTGTASTCVKAYHAADLYFADSDLGYGYYDASTGSVGGYDQAKDWYMVFTPLKPASHYEEAGYREIWNALTVASDLTDTIDTTYIDNGAALQWNFCLDSGQAQDVSDVWSFGDSAAAIKAAAQAAGTQSGVGLYRPVETGAPGLTTTIPTPLDVSFTPPVMGANLLWAALATIAFIIATELFNRSLADHEEFFQRLGRPFRAVGRWINGGKRAGTKGRFERLKLALIILIYALVFSLLDPTWQPLSVNGVWLFVTMGIAFGLVGLSDDIVQWNTARRWLLPTSISIRPGNLLLAGISALFSRSFGLLPGIMFGMPEAFEIDPKSLDRRRKNRLLLVAASILLAILAVSWLPTILTDLLLNSVRTLAPNVQPFLQIPLAALQSLLLLVFSVTLQNLFLHMLALPDTIGEGLKRWSRIVWFLALLATSFILLQFLLNPTGDLARSLEEANVRAFLITVAGFLVFSTLAQILLRRTGTHRAEKEPDPEAMPAESVPASGLVSELPDVPSAAIPPEAPPADET